MADSSPAADGPDADTDTEATTDAGADVDARTDTDVDAAERDLEALRREVDEKYDFDDFKPADMAKMTLDEWEAAFDPETWIVGRELLDRVEQDLRSRVASRDVFAVLERGRHDGEEFLLAYSDEGYALVYEDGSIDGEGTVLRDVKPSIALCSMEDYDPPSAPENVRLPHPEEVPQGTGEFGNLMLQVVAAAQILGGLGLLVAWLVTDLSTIVAPVASLFFVLIGLFLFTMVANARLSDRFRSEEYRARLRAVGLEDGRRPDFLPLPDDVPTRPVTGDDRDVDGS